jgi:hypothetical protein
MTNEKNSIKSGNGESQTNNGEMVKRNESNDAKTPLWAFVAVGVLAIVSYVTLPVPLQPVGEPTLLHVWYYGWITALSTGLGVLPLVFISNFDKYWVGISNGEYSDG